MGIITDLLLVGARGGAKKTARNTAEANRLAKKHHKQLTAQNAALLATQQAALKTQQDALHYQRYSTDPAYKQHVDETWARLKAQEAAAQQAALERAQRKDALMKATANGAIRVSLLAPLAVLVLVAWLFVWLPQALIGKARKKPADFAGRARMVSAWSATRSLTLLR